jgi:iron complex outermembrane receptor protein
LDGFLIHASTSYHWQSSYYTVVADPNSIVPSYGILNASVSVGWDDGRWNLTLFSRNLLDQYFVAGIFKTPLDTGTAHSTPLSTIGYANQPAIDSGRTVGIRLDLAFK